MANESGLVWVRRRNGSWWSGRIMGLHELSETDSCLVSPKSGTPVKLLGRHDATVDWYNLEKSKRVKDFRCGGYDDCIEKAKVSAASSSKKAVKYARREDAILHALELESAPLANDPLNFYSGPDKLVSEDVIDGSGESEDNSNSAPELSRSGISFEEPKQNGSSKMGRRRRTPNDSEDDGTDGVKRMRGLEDWGIGVVSKRKVQGAATLSNSNIGSHLANASYVNGGEGHSSTLKRKRSRVANVHEFLRRKSRRQQLTKVLESTAMVSVPVTCDQLPSSSGSPLHGVTDCKTPELDSNESKKSYSPAIHNSVSTGAACENGTSVTIHDSGCEASQVSHTVKENGASGISGLVENDFSDSLFDVPFVGVLGEEKHATGFSPSIGPSLSGKPQVGALEQQSCHVSQSEVLSLGKEGQNTGCTSSAADHNIIGHRTEKGSSKWQSKGNRNSRHISKNSKEILRKYEDMDDESSAYLAGIENSDGFSQGTGQKVDWNIIGAPNASYKCTSQARCKPLAEGHLDGFRDLSRLLPDGSLRFPNRQSHFTINSRYQIFLEETVVLVLLYMMLS